MSAEERNTLRAEAAPLDVTEAVEQPQETSPEALLPPVDPGLKMALTGVVAGLSRPICRKAKVTNLEQYEAEALGESLALLVSVYDVGPKDPRGAAWLGFGLVAIGVVGRRERVPGADDEAPPSVTKVGTDAPVATMPDEPPDWSKVKLNIKPMQAE